MNGKIRVFSAFSEDFVSPLFPKKGEKVKVSVVFSSRPEWAAVKAMSNIGLNWHYPLEEDGLFNGAYRYSAVIDTTSDEFPFRYFFCFGLEGKSYYYSRKGVHRNSPKIEDRFSLILDLEAPEWVSGSTCYQIFPDRFCNGDPSVGAVEGMYDFDGGTVTTPSFDSIPKTYNEARCIDFFNGDLKGIEDKLDFIKENGFDTLYLNPINSSMTVHRFDSIDFFSIDPKLGGDEAFESLCNKAHEKGMKVIVDISINHTSSSHPWLKRASEDKNAEEREYYYIREDGSVRLWQGVPTLVQLNYTSDKLREIIYKGEDSALRKFLRKPYLQDGWRLDVAPELGRSETDQLCQEVWREVRKALHEERKDLYLVGEDWDDSAEYCMGDMWDATMNYFGSGRPIRSWLGEKDRFLSAGWGHSPEEESPWSGYEMAEALRDGYSSFTGQMAFFQMNLTDSHDTPRLHNNRAIISEERYMDVLIVLYLLPGMPNVYYGDEVWLDGELGSVEASRYPMTWDEGKWNKNILEMHRAFGRMRKKDWLPFSAFSVSALSDDSFAIYRISEGHAIVGIANRGKKARIALDSSFLPKNSAEVLIGKGSVSIENGILYADIEEGESLVIEAR